MRHRRYEIHRESDAVWELVFDPGPAAWFVEAANGDAAPQRTPLADFEATDLGRRLQRQLAAALREAQDDL